jgi:hypothetical protein
MDNNTMRRLCEYLHGLRSGRRNNNGTSEQPRLDPESKVYINWNKGRGRGDGGRGKDQPR